MSLESRDLPRDSLQQSTGLAEKEGLRESIVFISTFFLKSMNLAPDLDWAAPCRAE